MILYYKINKFSKCFSIVFMCLTYLMYTAGICAKGCFGAITALSTVSFVAFICLVAKSRKDSRYDNMCLVGVFSFLIWIIADLFCVIELNGYFGELVSQIMIIVTVTIITLLSFFPARAMYRKTVKNRTGNHPVAASISSLTGILLGWSIGKVVIRSGSDSILVKTDIQFLIFALFVLFFQTISIVLIMQFLNCNEEKNK